MNAHQYCQDLLTFIDQSPSPWHAVASIELKLQCFAFQRLKETEAWSLQAGGRYYVVRDDSSIVLFVVGKKPLAETGFKILAAHTDSPGLRLKPKPLINSDKMSRLAFEVYGSPILASFTDRDLALAGRIAYLSDNNTIESRLIRFPEPILRIANLSIHLNRNVNEDGLKLNKQTELSAIFACEQQPYTDANFLEILVNKADLDQKQILSWELNAYDTQKGEFWGLAQSFYANSQLDNLASCHAGLSALLDENLLNDADSTLVCAFFDHEEIGSESAKGASGSFLMSVLQRIANANNCQNDDYQRALAKSFNISADMAHAYQPNYPNVYEPEHKVIVNQGPVIKINSNQRYASECQSIAQFILYCQQAEVPYQQYVHRGNLPCGTTIGPIVAANLGIRTVDVGNPMWAMHSIRESAGVYDHYYMIKALKCFFSPA